MPDLIYINEIPGRRLIDAYDLTELQDAINALYQGRVAVRIATTLTIEIEPDDYGIIVMPPAPAPVTVYLKPDPEVGDSCYVKDGTGMAGTAPNRITVYPDVGTVDGEPYYQITVNYQSATFTYNGAQWNVT